MTRILSSQSASGYEPISGTLSRLGNKKDILRMEEDGATALQQLEHVKGNDLSHTSRLFSTLYDSCKDLKEQIQSPKTILFFKDLTAGGVAGAVSRTVVSPLERMKILFQLQTGISSSGQLQQYQYRGIWSTLVHIWKTEGWIGYWKGNGTNILRIVPYSAVQFASYEKYKKWILENSGSSTGSPADLDIYQRLLAGAMAGTTSVIVTYPLDLIRTRLSLKNDSLPNTHSLLSTTTNATTTSTSNSGGKIHSWRKDLLQRSRILQCGRTIIKEEGGWIALYRGLFPTILGIAPYVGINFAAYETFKKQYSLASGKEPSVTIKLWCGGASGALAQTLTYPLDVLRRRLQVHGSRSAGFHYPNLRVAIVSMMRQEGPRSFYKGMLPNLLKVIPSMSVSFVTYEAVKRFLY